MTKIFMFAIAFSMFACSIIGEDNNDECTCDEGDTKCSQGMLMHCQVTDGCGEWVMDDNCSNYGGECVVDDTGNAYCDNISCNNIACEPGSMYCEGTTLYHCNSDWCGHWEITEDCADSGQVCFGASDPMDINLIAECAAPCEDECDEVGTTICTDDDSNTVFRCEDLSACNVYVELRDCTSFGQVCVEETAGAAACIAPE